MVYSDGASGIAYAKRFNVTGVTRDKEYFLAKSAEKSKIHYMSVNLNGEAESVKIILSPNCTARIKEFDFFFDSLEVKGRSSVGNQVTKYPVKAVKLKEAGKSTLLGRKLWFDDKFGRLNTDEKGIYLGTFEDEKLLVITKDGNYEVNENKLSTLTAGTFPNPENIEVFRPALSANPLHTALAAPGNLLQSDLLQSLGSALTTRSDTFTLRCFGEAAQSSGETGSAWMEVLVQRVPEFIDPANAPETGNSAPRPLKIAPSVETDASVSTALTKVNNILGRRFKVISMRWLKADEI